MDAANPTARALLCLEIVQDHPGITAERLAARLGVSDRAARRYVAVLREAGIPVESVRGPYGGYRIGRALRLPPLRFDASEALGLVMAVLDGHHGAGDPGDPVGVALGKLLRALPETVARNADTVRRTAAPAPDRGAARPDPWTVTALVGACSDGRRVRLGYRSEAGTEWEGEVDPWAVVIRHGRWYLLCWSHASAARRAYRIDRVTGAEVLDEGIAVPEIADPVAELEQHLAAGWEYASEVVVDLPADALTGWLPRTLGRVEEVDDDHCRLVGSTSNPGWYAEQLAALPAAYRIVGGPELREAARTVALRMLAAVDEAEPTPGGTT